MRERERERMGERECVCERERELEKIESEIESEREREICPSVCRNTEKYHNNNNIISGLEYLARGCRDFNSIC